ncbi:MAG TPA: DUF4861 family protein [Bacteroidales bacterium]|nr:DUF4861 family protein [Bacteroidales bacterium]
MKSRLFVVLNIAFITLLTSCSNRENIAIRFSNPLNRPLSEEVVRIPVNTFTDSIGKIPAGKRPVFTSGSDTLVSQCVDFNNDGSLDYILVLVDLPANGTKDATVTFTPEGDYPFFNPMTNLRFSRLGNPQAELDTATRLQTTKTEVTSTIFQMEGPAWENDKVGFRNYFDLRNGNDIFGKQAAGMVLDSVGLDREIVMANSLTVGKSYHDKSQWGMDVLKVGNSLGAGSVALMENDSLYRIGDNGYGTFMRMFEGPLQSEFMLSFPQWKAGNDTFDINQYVSVTAGKYRYKSSLVIGHAPANVSFVTGIVNKHSDSLYVEKVSDHYTALLTHAVQSEDTAMLTMVLLIPDNELNGYNKTRDTGEGITETYYATLDTHAGVPATYWFYAFWATGNPEFKDLNNVLAVLRKDASLLEKPVSVSRIK